MTEVTRNKVTADKNGKPVKQEITLTNENGSSTGIYAVHNGRTVLVQVDYKQKK